MEVTMEWIKKQQQKHLKSKFVCDFDISLEECCDFMPRNFNMILSNMIDRAK